MLARFYNPHPGLMGCTVRLPEAIKVVANQLDGKVMDIDHAAALIRKTANGLGSGFSVESHEGCIFLRHLSDIREQPEYCWRVICFESSLEEVDY